MTEGLYDALKEARRNITHMELAAQANYPEVPDLEAVKKFGMEAVSNILHFEKMLQKDMEGKG